MEVQAVKAPALEPVRRPLVQPGTMQKTGCLWCPLLPWSADFDAHRSAFCRDAEKVLSKEPDGHTVRSRAISEEWSAVDVLFVGEAPGADEDKQGQPFIGRSGKLLRNAIEDVFKGAQVNVGISNLIRCRPPRNRNPNRTEIQSCSPELLREIAARKPRLLVVLGNYSMEFLTGKTGITTLAGKVLQATHPDVEGMPVVACLHPAYVLRFDHELTKFVSALQVARDVLTGEHVAKLGVGEVFVLDDLDDVRALFESFALNDRPVAFDTETGSLNWWQTSFPRLLCFSFSDEEGTSYVIPYDHAESPWRADGPKVGEREELDQLLRDFFLSSIPKLAQNGKFDAKHIRAALGVVPVNVRDTMTTHLMLDERRGTHGLDSLAFQYTGMGGYDSVLDDYKSRHAAADPERGGSYANIPADLLFQYAGCDADVTLRVNNGLREESEYRTNPRFQRLSETFLPALSETLADMEWNGAKIDPAIVAELDVQYTAEMERASAEIAGLETVQKLVSNERLPSFNPGSSQQLQTILFSPDYYDERPVHLTKGGLERLAVRHQRKLAEWRPRKKVKEPEFTETVMEALARKEWGHFSTDAEALQELEMRGNELAAKIVSYRGVATLHGTFVKPLMTQLDPFDCIHCQYLLHGTVTGRLASIEPNLQNIPNKGEGRVKYAYVSRFGNEGLICQADYSQIELRIGASVFEEPTMIRAYCNGIDVHTLTAIEIAKMTAEQYGKLEKHVQKAWRNRAKRINFGILYQGGPKALVKTLKKDGIFISEDEASALIDRYYEIRPALRAGIDRIEKSVMSRGYLESFTGRRRRVPEVESVDQQLVSRALRQAVNFPVQSGASDMTLMSLVLIDREMKRREMRSLIILTVHDSIVFDCHVDEFVEVLRIAKETMETLPSRSDEVLPGLDWKWLKTPIVAECEAGTRWGTTVEFNPFTGSVDELWDRMAAQEAA